MKRLFMLFLTLCLLATPMAMAEVITPGAGAETIKVGDEVTIDDVCTFTVKAVQEYDMFMGVSSGSAQQFLVVSFDMLNWQTEPFYVRTQTGAEMVYAEDFLFTPTYLWSDPGGTYYMTTYDEMIRIYGMDENNALISNGSSRGNGYQVLAVEVNYYDRFYNPIDDYFVAEHDMGEDDPDKYYCTDSSKTVLAPLVERTYHYVFQVPEIVARDEGLRVLTLNIGENAYQLRF